MSEDLLDRWQRLIKPLFPENAWVVSRYSGEEFVLEIDWKTNDSPDQPRLRTQKKVIVISGKAIEDYLERNKEGRDLFEQSLLKRISERFNVPGSDRADAPSTPSVGKLVITKEMLS